MFAVAIAGGARAVFYGLNHSTINSGHVVDGRRTAELAAPTPPACVT